MILPNLNKKRALLFTVAGLIIGYLVVVGVRFINSPEAIHYHANFGLFINGQRDKFDGPGYYEEVEGCYEEDEGHEHTKGNVHMHDQVNDVIHVHAEGQTWADFFKNLDYALTDKAIVTESGAYYDGQNGNKLTFILNGQKVTDIAGEVINSEDTLLINYGKNANIDKEYSGINHSARDYNTRQDPATCKGGAGSSFSDRIVRALKFWE